MSFLPTAERAPRGTRRGLVDPRLLEYTTSTRRYLVCAVLVGGCTGVAVIAQAWLVADVVSAAFVDHRTLGALRTPMILLLVVVLVRAALGWVSERAAASASASTKSELRMALVRRIAALDSREVDRDHNGQMAVLATVGIDALDAYFARYLPQVFLSVIVPTAIIAVVGGADWISAVIIAVTVPLIPVFMALVGASTRARSERRLRTLQRLAGHFLDVVSGLPTLKVFGRAKAQALAIRSVTDQYRTTTMATLRIAFLSSLVLELLATISVALVAVAVGLRLLGGHLDFRTALFVLVLAPEAYLPMRLLGSNFHASADGQKAAELIFEIIERPTRPRGTGLIIPDPSKQPLIIDRLTVAYPGRVAPALRSVSFTIEAGEVVVVTGPNGCGKSTLLRVVAGLTLPTEGSIRIGKTDLIQLDPDRWREKLIWVPQRPHLFAGSVAENVALGRPGVTGEEVRRAIRVAGLEEVVDRLPAGDQTALGEGGAGLSAGERQRLALARAFLREAPLLVLDEPTANLDGSTEDEVVATLRQLTHGRTVLMAAHRGALLALGDRVVELESSRGPA